MAPPINNLSAYNKRMSKSIWDKAFFADKLPHATMIIDFGCADGSLLHFLQAHYPVFTHLIGFDSNLQMVDQAKENGVTAFADMRELIRYVRSTGIASGQIAVVFSSVFHEVFHYQSSTENIDALMSRVRPGYIVIRDMMYLDKDPFALSSPEARNAVYSKLPYKQIEEFESYFGSLTFKKNLIHLLLKYRYTDNWERECEEDYFSYNFRDLFRMIDPNNIYDEIWYAQYTLPWVRAKIAEDFGIDMGNTSTHYTMILKKHNSHLIHL